MMIAGNGYVEDCMLELNQARPPLITVAIASPHLITSSPHHRHHHHPLTTSSHHHLIIASSPSPPRRRHLVTSSPHHRIASSPHPRYHHLTSSPHHLIVSPSSSPRLITAPSSHRPRPQACRYGLIGANGSGKTNLICSLALRELPVPEHIDLYHLHGEASPAPLRPAPPRPAPPRPAAQYNHAALHPAHVLLFTRCVARRLTRPCGRRTRRTRPRWRR
jgi:hypothetical protein